MMTMILDTHAVFSPRFVCTFSELTCDGNLPTSQSINRFICLMKIFIHHKW